MRPPTLSAGSRVRMLVAGRTKSAPRDAGTSEGPGDGLRRSITMTNRTFAAPRGAAPATMTAAGR